MALISINPTTGETIREYKEMMQREIEQILSQSQNTFLKWRRTDFAHRSGLLEKAAASRRAVTAGRCLSTASRNS